MSRLNYLCIAELVSLIIISSLLTYSNLRLEGIQVKNSAGEIIGSTGDTPNEADFRVSANFSYFDLLPQSLNIIPDDCVKELRINQMLVPIEQIAPERLCNWDQGFSFDARPYIQPGINSLSLKLYNRGGQYALKIESKLMAPWRSLAILILVILFLHLLWCMFSYLNFSPALAFAVLGGIAPRIWYLTYTAYNERTHDVDAHLDYIYYIANNLALPDAGSGWEYHQAPLYYILASVLYKFSKFLGLSDTFMILQVFSLLISCIFLVFATKTLALVLKPGASLCTTVLLLSFWPAGVIHSIRIGNDPLLYCFSAVSLYFLLKWWTEEKLHDLYRAAFYAGFATLTKTNAIILIMTIAALVIVQCTNSRERLNFFTKSMGVWIILAFCLVLNLGDNYLSFTRGLSSDWMSGSTPNSLNNILVTGNKIYHYVLFDIQDFVSRPFATPWEVSSSRQYFWNYALKTSLFAEFKFDQLYLKLIGWTISITLLGIVLVVIWGIIQHLYNRDRAILPLSLYLLLSILFLMLFRFKIPSPVSSDFRFIVPSLISVCALYAYAASKFPRGDFVWRFMPSLLTFIFVGGSILFFIILGMSETT